MNNYICYRYSMPEAKDHFILLILIKYVHTLYVLLQRNEGINVYNKVLHGYGFIELIQAIQSIVSMMK